MDISVNSITRACRQFPEAARALVKHPSRLPSLIKDEIRCRGGSYAGALELATAAMVALSTGLVAVNAPAAPVVLLVVAETLLFGAHLVETLPIPAVKENGEQVFLAPKQKKDQEVLKKIRKIQIKSHALMDAFSDGLTLVAGVLLLNPLLVLSSVWCVASDKIHFSGVQGEAVPPPSLQKGIPLLERIREYREYGSALVKNNPNLRAEMVSLPGIWIWMFGLAQVLPKWQIPVFLAGYSLASICRASTIAIQESEGENEAGQKPSIIKTKLGQLPQIGKLVR